ncbi:glycosyltransferase family 2 protein [Lacihabitans sp. CS3-21]|uniref:glycosyltransferase family 2 protein n=1 Tax=Lacihabitans sp. CS3-21 TaxID=2487332 RepID=UPI0020CE40F8|nr:glycosyltransferase family 2 protein [Lacihabitans sp. CS3-21]MCP9746380.1 glycosyltransferase [Lacihabitans sp. CS3-21]
MSPKLLLVVPCYNEQEILHQTNQKLNLYFDQLLEQNKIDSESKICYINDGSKDVTWTIIDEITKSNSRVLGIKLAKNFGHQNAVLAGLFSFIDQYDCYVSIDADLQDDINAIGEMVAKYSEGNSVVYGVREDRSSDTFFKKFTAELFYKIMDKLGVPVVFNHADFRLIDNKVLKEFANFKEYNMFIRGIIPTIGFPSDKVYYKRLEREAGESKYPFSKMLAFAWKGITSFSTVPMRMVLWFGIINFIISVIIGLFVLSSKLRGVAVSGWTSIVLPMAFFSGSNMIAIGLIGEYIGKIYEEVKGRPRYIIEKISGDDAHQNRNSGR